MITLLDYGAGNVRSVVNAIESLGETVKVVSHGKDILSAEKLIFPGVGAFGNMMHILNKKNYVAPLKAYLHSNRPYLGICLGLQALFDGSTEATEVKGLGILPGAVERFDIDLAVPHIGWNGLNIKKPSYIFKGLGGNPKFYFVHSYYVVTEDDSLVLTTTDYGGEFVSSIQKNNIIATQFHPEKSGGAGLNILKNFMIPVLSRPDRPTSQRKPNWPSASLPAWMFDQTIRGTWWSLKGISTMSGKMGTSEIWANRLNWPNAIIGKGPTRLPSSISPDSEIFPWKICRCSKF